MPPSNSATARQRTPRRLPGAWICLSVALAATLLSACNTDEIGTLPEVLGCADTNITDAGFESGNLTNAWNPQDMATPFDPLRAEMSNVVVGCCQGTLTTAPTEGSWVMTSGFDGDGPDTVRIAQDITVSGCASAIVFDYWAAWNNGGVMDRTVTVKIEPEGGGAPMQTDVIQTAPAGTIGDTGIVLGGVDVRAFRSLSVRIAFELFVPESFQGPGAFQLDKLRSI